MPCPRSRGGFLYEEDLPGNGFMDWVNFIRFGGSEYLSKGKRGGGDQVEKSRLGEVLYRVAFHVDANLVPGDYRPRAGDAAFLSPGTAIHSVDGYSPSEVLAAVVDGEVWLFDRPGPAISIPYRLLSFLASPRSIATRKRNSGCGGQWPTFQQATLTGWMKTRLCTCWPPIPMTLPVRRWPLLTTCRPQRRLHTP